MKHLFYLLMASCFVLIASCKQPIAPVPTPTNANVNIHFNHKVNGATIIQDTLLYTNASGNLFSVHLLKYYVSNIILVKDDGSEFKLNNYDLINAFDANYSNANASNVPNGTYTSMKFFIGVDSLRNHTGAQEGDLDPANNMFWSWSTGYVFFKHEGSFKDSSNNIQPLLFHLGNDRALSAIQIPVSLVVNGEDKIMNINFDITKMYNAPLINFNFDNNHMSTSVSDSIWINNMIANMNDVFSFESVQ